MRTILLCLLLTSCALTPGQRAGFQRAGKSFVALGTDLFLSFSKSYLDGLSKDR